jgi:hypothetical protein
LKIPEAVNQKRKDNKIAKKTKEKQCISSNIELNYQMV